MLKESPTFSTIRTPSAAVRGKNGFVCMVERSWMEAFNSPEFWNPKVKGTECLNRQAARIAGNNGYAASSCPTQALATRSGIFSNSTEAVLSWRRGADTPSRVLLRDPSLVRYRPRLRTERSNSSRLRCIRTPVLQADSVQRTTSDVPRLL